MESSTVIVVFVGIMAIFRFVFATFMTNAAIYKGHGDEAHPWIMCFLLGILGGLYVIALPDKISQEQNAQIIKLLKEKDEPNEKK